MEVYKVEDIVKLIHKKIEDIFTLMVCLHDDSKLSLWHHWQDVTNKFHANIIKIKRDNETIDELPQTIESDNNDEGDEPDNVQPQSEPVSGDADLKNSEASSNLDLVPQISENQVNQTSPVVEKNEIITTPSFHDVSGTEISNSGVNLTPALSVTEAQSKCATLNIDLLASILTLKSDFPISNVPVNNDVPIVVSQTNNGFHNSKDNLSSLSLVSTERSPTPNLLLQTQPDRNVTPSVPNKPNQSTNLNVPVNVPVEENAKTIPDSDILANDLRQLADLAAEVPYNYSLPVNSQGEHKSLASTLLDKETCQETGARDEDKQDGQDNGKEEDIFNSEDQNPTSTIAEVSEALPQSEPRKYPKRNRKSKKDDMFSYTDIGDDTGTPKSNKENQKKGVRNDKSDIPSGKTKCRRKRDNLIHSKEDFIENIDGSVTCKICGLRLARITSIGAHHRQHTGSRPFKCSICPQSFTTKANMIRHENTHNGIRPYECQVCRKSFGEKKTLKIHMLTHSGEKPFKCPICSESFAQKGTLQYHIYRHTGHKGYLCADCGKSFRQKSQLKCHRLRQHEKTPSFNCDFCSSTFYSKGDLERHKLKHTNNKPYVCDICCKSYTRPEYLKQHQNIHKGLKPYFCQQCNVQFHQASQFYRHIKKHPKETTVDSAQNLIHEDFEIPVMENLTQEQVAAVLESSHGYGEVFHITYLEQPGTIIDEKAVSDGITVTSDMLVSSGITVSDGTVVTNAMPVSHGSGGIILTSNMNDNTVVTVSDTMEVTESVSVNDSMSDSIDTVVIQPTIDTEVDFSAINLLANATTQLTQ